VYDLNNQVNTGEWLLTEARGVSSPGRIVANETDHNGDTPDPLGGYDR
jgi:hypothetical protein